MNDKDKVDSTVNPKSTMIKGHHHTKAGSYETLINGLLTPKLKIYDHHFQSICADCDHPLDDDFICRICGKDWDGELDNE